MQSNGNTVIQGKGLSESISWGLSNQQKKRKIRTSTETRVLLNILLVIIIGYLCLCLFYISFIHLQLSRISWCGSIEIKIHINIFSYIIRRNGNLPFRPKTITNSLSHNNIMVFLHFQNPFSNELKIKEVYFRVKSELRFSKYFFFFQ